MAKKKTVNTKPKPVATSTPVETKPVEEKPAAAPPVDQGGSDLLEVPSPDRKPIGKSTAEAVNAALEISRPKRFKVHLKCPTPLTENPAIVTATNETNAHHEFCKLNGISNSKWPFEIAEVDDSESDSDNESDIVEVSEKLSE